MRGMKDVRSGRDGREAQQRKKRGSGETSRRKRRDAVDTRRSERIAMNGGATTWTRRSCDARVSRDGWMEWDARDQRPKKRCPVQRYNGEMREGCTWPGWAQLVTAFLYLQFPEPSDVQTPGPILPPFRVRFGIVLGAVGHSRFAGRLIALPTWDHDLPGASRARDSASHVSRAGLGKPQLLPLAARQTILHRRLGWRSCRGGWY